MFNTFTTRVWSQLSFARMREPQNLTQVVWLELCNAMPIDSISMFSNTFYVSNMDAGSSLMWLSASTMTLCNHFDSTSETEPQNLTQVVWV